MWVRFQHLYFPVNVAKFSRTPFWKASANGCFCILLTFCFKPNLLVKIISQPKVLRRGTLNKLLPLNPSPKHFPQAFRAENNSWAKEKSNKPYLSGAGNSRYKIKERPATWTWNKLLTNTIKILPVLVRLLLLTLSSHLMSLHNEKKQWKSQLST